MKEEFCVTVLGSGTSQGVPVIGCQCHVCQSKNPYDKRLRSSILITWNNSNFVIDAGPDFRQQMLREDIRSLDGVVFTHEHKDHIAGLDDVRAFNFLEKKDMDLYCSERVSEAIKREFHYAFGEHLYPGVPKLKINIIDTSDFQLPNGPSVTPILGYHHKLPVFGFRIENFAYLTDVKTIPIASMNKLLGIDTLIIDCLRIEPHISHLHLEEALKIIDQIGAKQNYLTHISHLFGTYGEILKLLPKHVKPAYDGLKINL